MANIESRKATVRALYRENPSELRPEALKAFARAEEYFGFGSLAKRREDLPPDLLEKLWYRDVLILARLMAEVLFAKPGRGRQTKDWSEGKLHNLGQVYFYMKKRKPALSDRQIAEVLAEQPECGFGKNAELIRQRLPSAKRIFVEYCVCRASSFVYDVFCEEEVYILEKKGVTPPAPMTLVAGPHHGAPFIWFKVSRV
jgi:hypothetical protein